MTLVVLWVSGVFGAAVASAQSVLATNTPAAPALPASASMLFTLFRVMGALAIVLAVFFGGLWLFRNWQRVLARNSQSPKLNVIEVKSLGQRHALYVVGYEQQRMLIASSPTGITMLTSLPAADVLNNQLGTETEPMPRPRFTDALFQALQRSPREIARALRMAPTGGIISRGKP